MRLHFGVLFDNPLKCQVLIYGIVYAEIKIELVAGTSRGKRINKNNSRRREICLDLMVRDLLVMVRLAGGLGLAARAAERSVSDRARAEVLAGAGAGAEVPAEALADVWGAAWDRPRPAVLNTAVTGDRYIRPESTPSPLVAAPDTSGAVLREFLLIF